MPQERETAPSDATDWRSETVRATTLTYSRAWSQWSQPNAWRPKKDKQVHVYSAAIEYGQGVATSERA
jgi:hypothetical protein